MLFIGCGHTYAAPLTDLPLISVISIAALCILGMMYFFCIAEYDRFTEEWELVDGKKFSQLGTQERVKDKEDKIAYYGM